MKGKNQKGSGRPRTNRDSDSRFNAPERNSGNERRKFSAPGYKKEGDSGRGPRNEDFWFKPASGGCGEDKRRSSPDRDGSGYRRDRDSGSRSEGESRFKPAAGGFGSDKRRSSPDRDTSGYKRERNPERNFRAEGRGDKEREHTKNYSASDRGRNAEKRNFPSNSESPRYKKDSEFTSPENRRFSPQKDNSRFGKAYDSDRKPRGEFSPGRASSRFKRDDQRGFGADKRNFSSERDNPRFGKERDFEKKPRGEFSSGRDSSRFKKDDERGFESKNRRFSSENSSPRYKRDGDYDRNSSRSENYRPERKTSPQEDFREERGSFKTFKRKKDEPFEYGKGVKPQHRPDYSEENLIRNIPEKQRKKISVAEKKATDQIRLNRYIANSGLCSRREADDLIESGQITVNGKTITEMGYQVKVTDVVKYGRKILNPEKLVYVLLNKPKDFITTTDDPEGRRTVMDLVAKAGPERIYPVGRLDRATTGLLLFTNDGELADKLSHPSHEIRKIYQVEINKPLSREDFDRLVEGIELEDGFIKPDEVSVVTPDQQVIGIEIHSGKNRVVRRIFEHLGYEVTQLDRTTYAGLTKKDLPRGNWRFLTEKEVIRLKYMI